MGESYFRILMRLRLIYENPEFIEDILVIIRMSLLSWMKHILILRESRRSAWLKSMKTYWSRHFPSCSMAGMRIGYAIRQLKFDSCRLQDVKYSFNSYTLNQTALVCGTEALKDREYFRETTARIIETREWVKEELSKLGFDFPDLKSKLDFCKAPGI